jgi:hypothetical protein
MVKVYLTTLSNTPEAVIGYYKTALSLIPGYEKAESVETADVVFLLRTWCSHSGFNLIPDEIHQIIRFKKPVVVFDYMEGPNLSESLLFNPYGLPQSKALKIYEPCQVLESCTKVYFKSDFNPEVLPVTEYPIYPTDYVNLHDVKSVQGRADSEDDYQQRQIDLLFIYGVSRVDRPILHAELLRVFASKSGNLAHDKEQLDFLLAAREKNIVALICVKEQLQIELQRIYAYQAKAKISLGLMGYGRKCFRDAEACLNSIIALQESPARHAYPWQHKVNCLKLPGLKNCHYTPYEIDPEAAVAELLTALDSPLYPIYQQCVANSENYLVSHYAKNYWRRILQQHGVWEN